MTEKFTVADVARIHGLQIVGRESAKRTFCVCPFCGKKKDQFSYVINNGKIKDVWGCFSCGNKGKDAVSLHIALSEDKKYEENGEINYKKAYKDIWNAINGNETLQEAHAKNVDMSDSVIEDCPIAEERVVSHTFNSLLKKLTLNNEHKADLTRRGLTAADINYFSFKSVQKDVDDICKRMLTEGYELLGTPGFYQHKGRWNIHPFYSCPGYLCPVIDGKKRVVRGFQIRLDNPIGASENSGGTKYTWVSSGSKGGTSSGAICSFLQGTDGDKVVIVVEGILKAIVTYCLLGRKVSVIGFPGVECQNDLIRYIPYLKNSVAFLAFDMDRLENPEGRDEQKAVKIENLKKCCSKMTDFFISNKILCHELKWDQDNKGFWNMKYKGIDDFLLEYPDKEKFISYLNKLATDMLSVREMFN